MMPPPVLAVTMGDPAGVGPELCLRLLADESLREVATPVVLGDARLLARCAKTAGLPPPPPAIAEADLAAVSAPSVLDLPGFDETDFQPGVATARTGAACHGWVEKAIEFARAGQVAGVVTAPIHKEAWHAAGVPFPGHTELFAARTGARRSCMFQYSDEVRAAFVTAHAGYAEVPALLTTARILEVIELAHEAMARVRGPRPRIGVLGLNPHAGEHGLFGRGEEERIIAPAIHEACARGILAEGPIPPDTAFLPARRRTTDAFVCMYHDQGHIPLKALAFDSAVNVTLGLPIVRTSVDHGTACDIAWRGEAGAGSLFAAVRLAATLARPEPGSARIP